MTELVTAFAGGILGSAHCIGMCGGFAALVGSTGQPLMHAASRQLMYGLGRVFTYMFLGALAGFAGQLLSRSDGTVVSIQRIFSIGAGVFMILVGAGTLFRFSVQRWFPSGLTLRIAAIFRTVLKLPGRRSLFLVGVANGFLPCGLVYAFLAMAVAAGSMIGGMLIMLLFGAGTIPAMTVVGCGSSMVSHRLRSKVLHVAAVLVMVTGGICIQRGWAQESSCCEGHEGISTASIPEVALKIRPGGADLPPVYDIPLLITDVDGQMPLVLVNSHIEHRSFLLM
ncbi:MAG: sulfite exporter TauE/SafE family protein [Planctomycetota bacterium]|jgi:sulfite exporter TauE/SafE